MKECLEMAGKKTNLNQLMQVTNLKEESKSISNNTVWQSQPPLRYALYSGGDGNVIPLL